MSTLLKDLYSREFYDKFGGELNQILADFDTELFKSKIFDANWATLELKERMRHTAFVLHDFLPKDFDKAAINIENLTQLILENPSKSDGFLYLFLAEYIERFGINHFETSVYLIEKVTQLSSCEFVVRPFIVKYPNQMIAVMTQWSTHENHHLRRLSTEGMRPRLPWGIALQNFKKDPTLILPILENLKNDPSEYVRKSVANNLNDISKDNPDVFLKIIHNWKNKSKNTDWIIKHGSRTLLKKGDPDIFKFYELSTSNQISVKNFRLNSNIIEIGQDFLFTFETENNEKIAHKIRLEYAIYYKRLNNTLSKKVFKISEKIIESNQLISIQKKQSFKPITTRKYYRGLHKISIIVNGIEKEFLDFELV